MNNVQNITTYTALIERCFPQLTVHTALPITSGWDSFVLEVNGELIFRFPMREDVVERLKQELRLLPILGGRFQRPFRILTMSDAATRSIPTRSWVTARLAALP
jgi:hypothetical protein